MALAPSVLQRETFLSMDSTHVCRLHADLFTILSPHRNTHTLLVLRSAGPCLTEWTFGKSRILPVSGEVNVSVGVWDERLSTLVTQSFFYPPRYALDRCAAHDVGLPPSCNAPADLVPSWCGNPWCWVDPQQCSVRTARSSYLPGYSFSYETCGSADEYSSWRDVRNVQVRACACAASKRSDVPAHA